MTRRRISAKERGEIFTRASGICHICGHKIEGGKEAWDVEHVIPLGIGGDEERGSENLQPAHVNCHLAKTATDKGDIAYTKRQRQRSMGIRRQPVRPLPGSKASGWKQKISGEWVRR